MSIVLRLGLTADHQSQQKREQLLCQFEEEEFSVKKCKVPTVSVVVDVDEWVEEGYACVGKDDVDRPELLVRSVKQGLLGRPGRHVALPVEALADARQGAGGNISSRGSCRRERRSR